MTKVALPNCSNLPDWEVDDYPFHRALEALDIQWSRPVWDDPDVDWSAFDGILIRTTWDYQEKEPSFVSWAQRASMASKFFNPTEVITWNTKKTYLRDLEEAGARLTPTRWLNQGESIDMTATMGELGWQRGFLKPVVGATARETLRFVCNDEGLAQAQSHVDRLLPSEGLMLQPYLESVETDGELSALYFDGEYSHGVRKVPVPGDYRVQDDFGASDEPYTFSDGEVGALGSILKALKVVLYSKFNLEEPLLYARIDVLRDGNGGLYLNELELVEPSLFFRHSKESSGRLAQALKRRLSVD